MLPCRRATMTTLTLTLTFLLTLTQLTTFCQAFVRRHPDGSLSSNAGPPPTSDDRHDHDVQRRVQRQTSSAGRLLTAYGLSGDDVQFLVNEHNRLRRLVQATDIKEMHWDEQLAASAQAYANVCTFQHSSNRVNTGENIWASPHPNFRTAVQMWFDEVYDRRCGCANSFRECCGHYTQVVWARSNRLGCGFARCTNVLYAGWRQYSLVCHYSPAGNIIRPGNVAVAGFTYRDSTIPVCSGCSSGSTCNEGLCSF